MSEVQIDELLPHGGPMSLLDAVTSVSTDTIACESLSHQRKDNPLREDGSLHAVNLVEYAAQAMALHFAFLSGATLTGVVAEDALPMPDRAAPDRDPAGPAPRMSIAALRNLWFTGRDLAEVGGTITINARRQSHLDRGAIYEFVVSTAAPGPGLGGERLASGQITLIAAA